MTDKKSVAMCNSHLRTLYSALKAGDVTAIRNLETELTTDEECVACAYALRISGPAQTELYSFLKKNGFDVQPHETSTSEALGFWSMRIILFLLLFGLIWFAGSFIKLVLVQNSVAWLSLGGFGLVTVLIFSIAAFVLAEYWFLA